jgi:hypothetical protein
MAEIETRLTGTALSPNLIPELAREVADGPTYVLVLFDGLGVAQLEHPAAAGLRASMAAVLEAPFPTTTSVSLATVATGLPPSQHGQVAHLTWMPDLGEVVNSLKWMSLSGQPVRYDYSSVLPKPNLWERLRSAGIDPITVQPGDFSGSPLTRVLYRGARFEGAWDESDIVSATVQLGSEPGRFIFTYVPHVDYAGHVFGFGSDEFTQALRIASTVWDGLAAALPPDVILLGTADHGLLEFDENQKTSIRNPRFESIRFAGDPRGVHLWGEEDLLIDLGAEVEGHLADPSTLVGPGLSALARERLGDQVLLAPDDRVFIPKGFDGRLRCYHGGLSGDEVQIPLLVG